MLCRQSLSSGESITDELFLPQLHLPTIIKKTSGLRIIAERGDGLLL